MANQYYPFPSIATEANLPILTLDDIGKGYYTLDTLITYIWDGSSWKAYTQLFIDPTKYAKVGFFVCPAVTGNFSITGLGFKPKVIEFIGHKNDGMQTWFMQSNGFTDEFLNQNVSSFCGNYSNAFRGDAKQDRCIYLFNASGAIQVNATLVSMDADGFTLNFTNVNTLFGIRWSAIG